MSFMTHSISSLLGGGGSQSPFGEEEQRSLRKAFTANGVLKQHRQLARSQEEGWRDLIQAETNISFVWNGDVSRKTRRENVRAVGSVRLTLVVSHCDKPLHWIPQFLRLSREDRIILESIHVFSKCGTQVEGTETLRGLLPNPEKNFMVTTLANVGRNDHSYATWILDNFESMLQPPFRPTDVVLFLKDNFYRFDYFLKFDFLSIDHVVGNAVTQGFGCLEQLRRHTNRRQHRRKREKEQQVTPNSTQTAETPRCMSAFHSLKWLRQFSISEYSREKRRDHTDNFPSISYANVGEWIDALGIDLLVGEQGSALDDSTPTSRRSGIYPVVPVCYGGQFAVTRGQLRSAQPRSAFEKMTKLLSRDDNIAEGHFSERLWSSVFSKPLSKDQMRDFRAVAKRVVASGATSVTREGVVLGMRVTNFECEPVEDFLGRNGSEFTIR